MPDGTSTPYDGAWSVRWRSVQRGLGRYNCADSLDRTNAATYFAAVQVDLRVARGASCKYLQLCRLLRDLALRLACSQMRAGCSIACLLASQLRPCFCLLLAYRLADILCVTLNLRDAHPHGSWQVFCIVFAACSSMADVGPHASLTAHKSAALLAASKLCTA